MKYETETNQELLDYALHQISQMEDEAWSLAVNVSDEYDGVAINIAVHLNRVLKRLQELQERTR